MKTRLLTTVLFVVFFYNLLSAQLTIHTIGDSTMEQKSEDPIANPNGQRGWPQMLSQFVVNGATINNRAKSGTSSKSFYEDKDANGNYRFWPTVKPQIKAGDYVIIQFAHNDEKDGGWQSDHNGVAYTGIGTNPWELYTLYLTKYVNEVRELGANPILFTPIVRNGFSGSTMSNTAIHNIGTDSVGRAIDYPAAMRKVAQDMSCPLIDHTLLTKAICEQYGQTKTSQLIYNVGDGTHIGSYGATLYARLAVQELIRQGFLIEYLNANPDLLISTSSQDFGKCYVNASSTFQITLSGVDLNPAQGNVSISSPAGFSISLLQNENYGQSLTLPYSNGNLKVTTVYVKFNPTTVGSYTGNIELNYGSSTKTITVKGESVSLSGGQKASAYWELIKDADAVSEGPITVIPQIYSNMVLQRYSAPNANTTWDGGAVVNGTLTQRNLIDNETGAWPAGEIDIVNDRYIQFGVSAIEGTTYTIDSIGLYAGGAGGSGMRFKTFVSKDPLFSDDVIMIADRSGGNNSNTMYPMTYNKLIDLNAGESLYLRVFPWYNGAASGKTICLYGVLIRGFISTSTAVKNIATSTLKAYCFPTSTTGKTTLNYQLVENSDITISMNSIDGRLLNSVIKRNQLPANYTHVFDLSSYSTGIYICKIKTSTGTQTIKIIKS